MIGWNSMLLCPSSKPSFLPLNGSIFQRDRDSGRIVWECLGWWIHMDSDTDEFAAPTVGSFLWWQMLHNSQASCYHVPSDEPPPRRNNILQTLFWKPRLATLCVFSIYMGSLPFQAWWDVCVFHVFQYRIMLMKSEAQGCWEQIFRKSFFG